MHIRMSPRLALLISSSWHFSKRELFLTLPPEVVTPCLKVIQLWVRGGEAISGEFKEIMSSSLALPQGGGLMTNSSRKEKGSTETTDSSRNGGHEQTLQVSAQGLQLPLSWLGAPSNLQPGAQRSRLPLSQPSTQDPQSGAQGTFQLEA